MNSPYTWVVPIAIIFPIFQAVRALIVFGALPEGNLSDFIYFMLGGLAAGLVFAFFMSRSLKSTQRWGTGLGFIIALPIALLGNLLGGLLHPLWGTLIYSAVPVLIGTLIGYGIGTFISRQ